MAPIYEPTPGCFLCTPKVEWVWANGEHYYAMAALGPVVEGMSIVASRAHARSMFDIPEELLPELNEFTSMARDRLRRTYDKAVHVTEHGRVGLCEIVSDQFEQHCYHAHRLLFPTDGVSFVDALTQSVIEPIEASSFEDARALGGHLTEYLYYQMPDGRVLLGTNDESTPRQFFRGVVADAVGQPDLRSWRAHPRPELADAAAARLAVP
ncbi:hypothetical protein BH10ACT3_BH10ACT3_00140 [soil metagenome]